MKHKKMILTVLLLLSIGIAALQAQQSVVASGGTATGSGGSVSYTIGQVAYHQIAGSNGSSSEGVQQPYEFFVSGIDEQKGITLNMSVFPNPAMATVNLKVETQGGGKLSCQLYDAQGKHLFGQGISNSITPIAMQSLAAGSYFLKVSDLQQVIKTFTIIKNN